jgi:aspartyl-tRNA(Asn)/glutamyl-tRNA(Gln) amidotransferase subunit A
MSSDLLKLSAVDLLDLYRTRRLSPVEVTRAALQHIEALNPVLNAFCFVAPDALATAAASEARWMAGEPMGPLDGVPVSIKDILLTRGWPTLRGSKTVDPAGPWTDDAPAVARLRESGAVLIGKNTTPEFGWKGVTDSPLTGITRNPWDPAKTPGGSSGGGAAAVASGMCPLTLGTDGGGSIRIPCAFTGIFGLKPSFGRVPAWPLSPYGTVAHIGPMSRTVRDTALLMNVIAQPDARDWFALPADRRDYLEGLDAGVRGWRIAYSANLGYADVDPEVAALVRRAAMRFVDLGAQVEDADPDVAGADEIFRRHWYSGAAYWWELHAGTEAGDGPWAGRGGRAGARRCDARADGRRAEAGRAGLPHESVSRALRSAPDADAAARGIRGRQGGRRRDEGEALDGMDAVFVSVQPDAAAGGVNPVRADQRRPSRRPAHRRPKI